MTIQRLCGLPLLLAALTLPAACSSLKGTTETPAQTPAPATTDAGSDVVVGSANTDAGLQSEAVPSAPTTTEAVDSANQAAVSAGVSVVRFPYDSDVLSSEDMELLRKHALALKTKASLQVRLEGHTDERGTQEYNMALGERRAKAVAVFLQSQGVQPGQFEVISYGELKPVASGEDEAAWAQNRRVELIYR